MTKSNQDDWETTNTNNKRQQKTRKTTEEELHEDFQDEGGDAIQLMVYRPLNIVATRKSFEGPLKAFKGPMGV